MIPLLTLRSEAWKERASCATKYQDIDPVISCISKAANVDDKSSQGKSVFFAGVGGIKTGLESSKKLSRDRRST